MSVRAATADQMLDAAMANPEAVKFRRLFGLMKLKLAAAQFIVNYSSKQIPCDKSAAGFTFIDRPGQQRSKKEEF